MPSLVSAYGAIHFTSPSTASSTNLVANLDSKNCFSEFCHQRWKCASLPHYSPPHHSSLHETSTPCSIHTLPVFHNQSINPSTDLQSLPQCRISCRTHLRVRLAHPSAHQRQHGESRDNVPRIIPKDNPQGHTPQDITVAYSVPNSRYCPPTKYTSASGNPSPLLRTPYEHN